MKIKELEDKLAKIPGNLDIGIWIWEDHEMSTNFHACPAEKVYLTTFKDAVMITCDMKGSKKIKIGTETYK